MCLAITARTLSCLHLVPELLDSQLIKVKVTVQKNKLNLRVSVSFTDTDFRVHFSHVETHRQLGGSG